MSDASQSDFNTAIIDEFRANAGKVGGMFEGSQLLLLTTTGAKSGLARLTPLVYRADGDRKLIIGSYGGAPKHPAWFLNLVANPTVTVEVGDGTTIEKYEATATVLDGEERDRLWAVITSEMPGFADYQAKTDRIIPVVALVPEG